MDTCFLVKEIVGWILLLLPKESWLSSSPKTFPLVAAIEIRILQKKNSWKSMFIGVLYIQLPNLTNFF